jgi:hypothetical protein
VKGEPDLRREKSGLRIHGLSKRHCLPAQRNSTFTPLHDRSQTQRNIIVENFNEFLTSPIGLIAAGVVAFVIGSMFFNVKQWEAHWKQHAIDLSKAMSKAGLIHTPKILDALATGDIAGAFREVKGLIDVFKDPKQLAAEFSTTFKNLLDAALKDPTEAKALQTLANDAVAAFASGDPTQAEGKLAADAQAFLSANPVFGPIAQNGLHLPTLALLPQIAGNPALAGIASVLSSANLGHLLPLVAAGAQAVQGTPTTNTGQQPAAPPNGTPPAPAPSASLPTVPVGHSVTINGPAAAAPTPAPAA